MANITTSSSPEKIFLRPAKVSGRLMLQPLVLHWRDHPKHPARLSMMEGARGRERPQVTAVAWAQEWDIQIPKAEEVIWRKSNGSEGFCKRPGRQTEVRPM